MGFLQSRFMIKPSHKLAWHATQRLSQVQGEKGSVTN